MTSTPGAIITYGIEWNVNKGTPIDEPEEALYLFTKDTGHVEFQWEDEVAKLVQGPEQLTGYWIEGKVFKDTAIPIPDTNPQDYSVTREYPAYTMSKMSSVSSLPVNWVDPTNPAKPRQQAGPMLTRIDENETGYAPAVGVPQSLAVNQTVRVGLHDATVFFNGFVATASDLPANPPANGNGCFFIDLETGRGYVWGDGVPGGTRKWLNTGVVQPPSNIDVVSDQPRDEVAELPLGDAAPEIGQWQRVNTGEQGTVYEYTADGWRNIGPMQTAGSFVAIPPEVKKSYVSGYIYPNVFDRCSFRYVPRLAPEFQETYTGDVSIETTGWFPSQPLDEERNIYPMDSVTHCLPDDRELVTIKYTFNMVTDLASSTLTVYQDVYQPTYKWENVIRDLLATCYYTNGIYH